MELGINYFDTAPSYGDGQSETNLGQVLKKLSADVYVGAPSSGAPPTSRDASRATLSPQWRRALPGCNGSRLT